VREPLFARGTYQVEVVEGKKRFYPVLQITDKGELTDALCSCEASEKGQGCPHAAAGWLRIFSGHEEPLHIRFLKAFWTRLFQMVSRKVGYRSDKLKKKKEALFRAESKTDKGLLEIEAVTAAAKKRLLQVFSQEGEEAGFKFSSVSQEEIEQWKRKEADAPLQFELSFWADLARWLLAVQDEGQHYQIAFESDGGLPRSVSIDAGGLRFWVYIPEAEWPRLIPSLTTVDSPLKVLDGKGGMIASAVYEADRRRIVLTGNAVASQRQASGIEVGEWLFDPKRGFEQRNSDPLIERGVVEEEAIPLLLDRWGRELEPFFPVTSDPQPPKYRLHIGADGALSIEMFLHEPGDIEALFLPWAYSRGGFVRLADPLFSSPHTLIPKADVASFINRHRNWLQQFPGFTTHLGSLEAHLTYRLGEEELLFLAELDFPDEIEEAIHYDEWAYLRGQGFYLKKEGRSHLPIHPGLAIPRAEIGAFITAHQEALEQVRHFFHRDCPIVKSGVKIGLTAEGQIAIEPAFAYSPDIAPGDGVRMEWFGDWVFIEGRGFSELPPPLRLPERFRTKTVIPPGQEGSFIAYELEPLLRFAIEIDPRLKKPEELRLRIGKLAKERRRKKPEWLVDLFYESELGQVSLIAVWDAIAQRKKFLFSGAGLLHVKELRFQWLKQFPKKRIDRKKGMVRLDTLEWIRLSVFELIEEPKGEEAAPMRQMLAELSDFSSNRLYDITLLGSTLRPYQESGLQWLWFLYCHGLSGLLCDDMGLGKTHQAMALLAAIAQEDPERQNKYLVVCPTSVIYHWQELLARFFPSLRVLTYYGLERSLQPFEAEYDLLLTSYGILRLGKDDLKTHRFELAIFDEIQIAKNYASQTHLALRKIQARMRLGLTGTPIENRIRELKALLDLVLPGYMPPDALFRECFITPIEKHQDPERKQLLSKLVKPFILRRKKSEVLFDLPEKIEEIAYCDLSAEQKQLYRDTAQQMRATLLPELQDLSKPLSYVHIFSALSTLKQICDHPALLLGHVSDYASHDSGKWDLFTELIHEAMESSQKVVVFSQYLDMLAIIEKYLRKKGIGFASIKGSTRDRSGEIRRFREDPECKVFVASLLAAGVGIDLTVASIVIHYDRWWNPAKENQATDRVHRIGQNRGVQVFKLVTKHTIEEEIHALIERKKGLLESVVGSDDQITFLSREELLSVFQKMVAEN
jgi:superfamily II DNA or RNA helicase